MNEEEPDVMAVPHDDPTVDQPALADTAEVTDRRQRFRRSLQQIASRSTADDLLRWILIPASLAVVAGFALIVLGWVGAARTARQIEQMPYLISGGILGLGLVFLGGLLLASAFWIVVVRKLQAESEQRSAERLAAVEQRIDSIAAPTTNGRATRSASRTRTKAASD